MPTASSLPSRQPLYLQVRERIIASLEAGEWSDGEALPSEIALAQRFQVSQGTVRKGLDRLVAEGVLVRRQGLGTFVSATEDDWGCAESPAEAQRASNTIELLACARSNAGEAIATSLGLRRAAPVYVIQRLVRIDGRPFAHIESCVSAERFAGLDARRIKQAQCNLRLVWLREFGVRVISNSARLRADAAPREAAKLLGIEADTPILEAVKTASTLEGAVVEWSLLRCRTDQYAYRG